MHLAIKLLKHSDLTFFRPYYEHNQQAKQKAINLNSNVFVDEFYPDLWQDGTFHFPLSITGPGGKPAQVLSRKVVRSPGGKNWRLNGELVANPVDDDVRYDRLSVDDYALFRFEGKDRPESVTLVLVSKVDDPELHGQLHERFELRDRSTMVPISLLDLYSLLRETQRVDYDFHPLEVLIAPDSIEEAIFGSSDAGRRQPKRRFDSSGRNGVIASDVVRAQVDEAAEVGHQGEKRFGDWLVSLQYSEEDFEWVSASCARASFDFELEYLQWNKKAGRRPFFIDVKATKRSFETPFHMSASEIRFASKNASYRVARIFDMGTASPKVKVLSGVDKVAQLLVEKVLGQLPDDVAVDSFQLSPRLFSIEYESEL